MRPWKVGDPLNNFDYDSDYEQASACVIPEGDVVYSNWELVKQPVACLMISKEALLSQGYIQ